MGTMVLLRLVLVAVSLAGVARGAIRVEEERKVHIDDNGNMIIPVEDKHMVDLHKRWAEQATSALLSAFTHQELSGQPYHVRKEFGSCTKHADSVQKHARCLTRLWDGEVHRKAEGRLRKLKAKSTRLQKLRRAGRPGAGPPPDTPFRQRRRRSALAAEPVRVRQAQAYGLKHARRGKSPAGVVGESLLKAVLDLKNRTASTSWRRIMQRAKALGSRRRELRRRLEDAAEDDHDFALMRAMQHRGSPDPDLDDLVDELDVMYEPKVDRRKLLQRLRESAGRRRDPAHRVSGLVRDGIKILYAAAGQNVTDFDQRFMRVVSPRLFSVVPETDETVDVASPSLLSLHDEGRGVENLTSIPSLVKNMGLDDQEVWLDLIMEAAGIEEQIADLEGGLEDPKSYMEKQKKLKKKSFWNEEEMRDANGKPLYFTKETGEKYYGPQMAHKVELFEQLQRNLSMDQMHQLNQRGVAMMSRDQVDLVYGPGSVLHEPETHRRLRAVSASQLGELVSRDVRRLSATDGFAVRQRDITLSPILFTWIVFKSVFASQPVILSPLVFSPIILSPTVFGVLVLSPWIFTPLVLSPRVVAPLILSPFAFSPLVLTPLVIHPIVLSPGIFTPIILSPVVLTPIVLAPFVFCPLVLTPAVLSPSILLPGVGVPRVLSPFVLSPIVLSPQALGALVLSPYALSPVLLSPLFFFSVILSPSWLS